MVAGLTCQSQEVARMRRLGWCRLSSLVALLSLVAAGLVAAVAAPAASVPTPAATWSILGPVKPTVPQGSLAGDSCTSTSWCVGVGHFDSGQTTRAPLAEAWNGATWKLQAAPNPTGSDSELTSVSCTSSTACVAVGFSGFAPLAETWNGTVWSIQTVHDPAGSSHGSFAGVSCTSATACVAVGSAIKSSTQTTVPMAEGWDGTGWTVQTTPAPAGSSSSLLKGISCSSAALCTAVGQFTDGANIDVTLAERLSGGHWVVEPTPNPPSGSDGTLAGVSCSSTTECTAAGFSVDDAGETVTLVEQSNGTAWKIITTPNAAGSFSSQLATVSCSAPTTCVAAGYSVDSAGNDVALAQKWTGGSWTITPTPGPSGASFVELDGLSCHSKTDCTAVGQAAGSGGVTTTLAEGWNGSSWKVQSTPNPGGATNGAFEAVSCTSPTSCAAVGYFVNGSGVFVTLAEARSGTSWKIEPTPDPTGASESLLTNVSCATAGACMAGGYSTNSAGVSTALAESWNGTSWKIQPTAHPLGASDTFFNGISCTSPTACTAVGFSINTAGVDSSLAESWNGTTWKIQPSPNPPSSPSTELNGISCISANACTAAGFSVNGQTGVAMTLAEVWNGISWSAATTPNPAGSTGSRFASISCTSAMVCTAVGEYSGNSGGTLTLAEARNGSAWKVEATPNRPSPFSNSLLGVSCTSTAACIAVGRSSTGVGAQTLAEGWNGTTWTIQATANPPGAFDSTLLGDSCASATSCTAVGNFGISSAGDSVVLAEAASG